MTLVLVSGLLTFPTVCRCGAEISHSHALYDLPGHTHIDHDDHTEDEQRRAEYAVEASPSGPTLQMPALATDPGRQTAASVHALVVSVDNTDAPVVHDGVAPIGRDIVPDPPPPRA